ncbi:hypothetical protein GCM10027290_24960 [Micromonospora sonneratiae]
MYLGDLRDDPFTGQRVPDEDDLTIEPGHAVTAGRHRVDGQLDPLGLVPPVRDCGARKLTPRAH